MLVGGLGGLGRAIASWMSRRGARSFIFVSPSGDSKPVAKETVQFLKDQGAVVAVHACDVRNKSQLEQVLKSSQSSAPIRGVIQMAMVMRNTMFKNMSLDDWNDSLAPKVQGTWNLHDAFSTPELDFFLMLSSTVGILGNASQAAYGAASTFLDSFAEYRNQLGLPSITIDIGMVLGVGYVAENAKVQQSLERQGFDGISEDEFLALMEAAFANISRNSASGSIITGLGSWHEGETRPIFATPRFSNFRRMALGTTRNEKSVASALVVRDTLRGTSSMEDAVNVVCDAIVAKMSALLMVPLEDISPTKSMQDYGMDSLVAVEMRNWIASNVGPTIPVLEMLGNASLKTLAGNILKKAAAIDPSLLESIEA
jgi:hypothetical protein